MMFLLRLSIVSILIFSSLEFKPKDKTLFISPVTIPLQLSSNFGELRLDHFHSGIDIKTQGVTGKEVRATADGYIYRISVSPGGFGNALYLNHPSGYSTVYGHLEKFTPEIAAYVKNMQYEKKSFLVTLFPTREMFPVKQGDLIGYSGNSGSSGGPHLHYEVRKAETEIPVNPLFFEFGTADNINPIIEKLAVYPINENTLINNRSTALRLNVSGGNGNYYIPSETEISIYGAAGFGIKAYDLLNDSYNKCAVYTIELRIDSISIFKYVMDEFSFNESKYINSHIDYEYYMRQGAFIERAYVLPNDRLTAYKDVVHRGIYNFFDNKKHRAQIIVTDVQNNKSTLSFNVTSKKPLKVDKNAENREDVRMMPYNKSNKFSAENISISIPSGALYDTLFFHYGREDGNKGMYSDLFKVHNIFTPVHKPFSILIKPSKIPVGKSSKMTIVQLSADMKKIALASSWEDGWLKAESPSFGNFYVGADTIAPSINANGLVPGADLSGKKEMRVKITDDFSGIKSYEPLIDEKWALFEYDQKNNVIIYKFDEKRIVKGTKHNLTLKVTDNKDNINYFNCDFKW